MDNDMVESDDFGLCRMPAMNVAYYWNFGYRAQENAWNVLLEWAYKNGILCNKVRFFGFPNPFHRIQTEKSGYEAWIVLPDYLLVKPDEIVKVKQIPAMTYAFSKDTYDTRQITHTRLEKWIVLNKYEFGCSVCLEEFVFQNYKYDMNNLAYYYMPINMAAKKMSGEVVNFEPLLLSSKVCRGEKNDIGRAVHWYASEWAARYWREEFYPLCRVFVTQRDSEQELLILYPDKFEVPSGGLEKTWIVGGKYLSFVMSSLVLRRYIPKCFKMLISLGYVYDKERLFLEEHFKHCKDSSKMMLGRIYFPIL